MDLVQAAESVARLAGRSRAYALPWPDDETKDFARYWFGHDQQVGLVRLSRHINDLEDTALRESLQLALSRTIITKSPKASLAADTSHSRPHRVSTSSTYDVTSGFLLAAGQIAELLSKRILSGNAEVSLGDVRSLDIRASSVDLVITSPPYLNAIDYLRGHRLSLIWFGYTLSELRAIRSGSVGAERALDHDPGIEVLKMVEAIQASVREPGALPTKILARYARDLLQFAGELHRVCKPDASLVVVIGNSTLRGNFIRNDRIVRTALVSAGFRITARTEREIPESRRYLPLTAPSGGASTITNRMRTEIVLSARRSS